MKLIKFDLPINGTKVRNLEELRDNFTREILELHASGVLSKWLKSRGLEVEAEKLSAMSTDLGDVDRLVGLCGILGVDASRVVKPRERMEISLEYRSTYRSTYRKLFFPWNYWCEFDQHVLDIPMHTNKLTAQLRAHIESHYPLLYLETFEERDADAQIKSVAGARRIIEWNMARGQVEFDTKRAMTGYVDLATALDTWLDMELDNHILVIKDAHLALRENPLAIARLKMLANKIVHDQATTATVFLVSSQPCVPPELEKFITLFDLPLPDEAGIKAIVGKFVDDLNDGVAENCMQDMPDHVATKLAQAFRGLSKHEIWQLLKRGYQQDGHIGLEDLDLVLAEKEQIIKKSGILEMVLVKEKLDDIGGLEKLKSWLKQKNVVLNDLEEARKFKVDPPKGIMIVGMPGCGKSLTAKAAAKLFELPLLRLDVGSLMGKYVGESEGNMRRALKQADAVSPCVLWIDELEKAFVGIGSGNAGSEVASRLFGYFLTWMQEKTSPVFVLATANDISSLPPELLRKGRFDEIFYVDFPNETERAAIFDVHLKSREKSSPAIDHKALAAKTDGFSGADIESVIKEAIENAFVDGKAKLDTERLLAVIKETQPLSVVMKDKVREYKEKFSQTKIKPAS